MNKNEIKKALYKQKPIASIIFTSPTYYDYMTEIVVNEEKIEVAFRVPKTEINEHFTVNMEAQLLIRWLV